MKTNIKGRNNKNNKRQKKHGASQKIEKQENLTKKFQKTNQNGTKAFLRGVDDWAEEIEQCQGEILVDIAKTKAATYAAEEFDYEWASNKQDVQDLPKDKLFSIIDEITSDAPLDESKPTTATATTLTTNAAKQAVAAPASNANNNKKSKNNANDGSTAANKPSAAGGGSNWQKFLKSITSVTTQQQQQQQASETANNSRSNKKRPHEEEEQKKSGNGNTATASAPAKKSKKGKLEDKSLTHKLALVLMFEKGKRQVRETLRRVIVVNALGNCVYDATVNHIKNNSSNNKNNNNTSDKNSSQEDANGSSLATITKHLETMFKHREIVGYDIAFGLSKLKMYIKEHSIKDIKHYPAFKDQTLEQLAEKYLGVPRSDIVHAQPSEFANIALQLENIYERTWAKAGKKAATTAATEGEAANGDAAEELEDEIDRQLAIMKASFMQ